MEVVGGAKEVFTFLFPWQDMNSIPEILRVHECFTISMMTFVWWRLGLYDILSFFLVIKRWNSLRSPGWITGSIFVTEYLLRTSRPSTEYLQEHSLLRGLLSFCLCLLLTPDWAKGCTDRLPGRKHRRVPCSELYLPSKRSWISWFFFQLWCHNRWLTVCVVLLVVGNFLFHFRIVLIFYGGVVTGTSRKDECWSEYHQCWRWMGW